MDPLTDDQGMCPNRTGGKTIHGKRKLRKRSLAELKDALALLMSQGAGRDPVPKVVRLLRQGLEGQVSLEECRPVFYMLKEWECFWRAALLLACDAATGKLKSPVPEIVRLTGDLAIEFTGYPMPTVATELSADNSIARSERLRLWIDRATGVETKGTDWFRALLVALITKEASDVNFEVLPHVATRFFRLQAPKSRTDHNGSVGRVSGYDRILVSAYGKIFARPSPRKIECRNLLDIASCFRARTTVIEKKYRQIDEVAWQREQQLQEEHRLRGKCQEELDLLRPKFVELQQMCAIKDQQLTEEAHHFRTMQQDHEVRLARELSGLAHNFRAYLLHEIQEATIALDMDIPDIAMARDRLDNMKEYLTKKRD